MKSQDILLLTKLICLEKFCSENLPLNEVLKQDDNNIESREYHDRLFTVRSLSEQLGFSKSEISNSLKRCIDVKLAKINRLTGRPETNKKAYDEFITHGFKYVFPVKPAQITRGIPTTFFAPVLEHKILSAGELKMVWADPRGKEMGQAIEPLYRSVPFAIKKDNELYAYLALLDAIRLGNARESKLAVEMLKNRLFK